MSDLDKFLDLLAEGLQPGERLVGCVKSGDPQEGGWPFKALTRSNDGRWRMPGNSALNRFTAPSAFRAGADGIVHRRKENWAAGLALMVDDVGEGSPSNKADWAVLDGWKPTVLIETSPGNFQCWFMLTEPCRDREKFATLLTQFAVVRGGDPAAARPEQPARTPEASNLKPKHGGWSVKVHHLDGPRYSLEDLADIFGLDLRVPYRRPRPMVSTEAEAAAQAHCERIIEVIKEAGLLLPRQDSNDLLRIKCPFSDGHTDGRDSGRAVVFLPSEKNGYNGAFDCPHAHCVVERDAAGRREDNGVGNGWREFTQWVDDQITEDLAATNAAFADAELEDFQ